MTTIHDAYINALLADATYAKGLIDGLKEGDLEAALNSRMTPTLAAYIGKNFEVVTHIESNDWIASGFDATVFKRISDGQIFVSMQGTSGLQDFITDIDLTVSGAAKAQIADMVNWWLKNTAPAGQGHNALQVALINGIFVAANPVAGTGILSSVTGVIVDGHSLGGHLATAFARLFGGKWPVQHVDTFNSAGFTIFSESTFKNLASLVGPGVSKGSFPNSTQTNFFAENGINATTRTFFNGQIGNRTPLFNEEDATQIGNHYMYKLTDALALGDAMAKLDNTLDFSGLNKIFEHGSNKTAESLEGVLDTLRKMLLGGDISKTVVGDVSDSAPSRVNYHENLNTLMAPDAQGNPTGIFADLAGKLIFNSPPTSGASARKEFGDFLSLYYLAPFGVTTLTTGAEDRLIAAQGDIGTAWKADKDLTQDELAAGKATFSDEYLNDRAVLLKAVLLQNKIDDTTGTVSGDSIPAGRNYKLQYYGNPREGETQPSLQTINASNASSGATKDQFIAFGDASNNKIDGTDNALGDHLYGDKGNDTLDGAKGADFLEGNEGDDTLNGGIDNDALKGGVGDDIYRFMHGDGWDVITDSDGLGSIVIDGVRLTGGAEKTKGSGIWISEDKQFNYMVFTESDGSKSLNIINLKSLSDRIFVKNFSDACLGISLAGGAISADTTIELIAGDKSFLDANGTLSLDEFGNPNGIAEPGRADLLYGSNGAADRVRGLGGDDIIYGRAGDDILEGGAGMDIVNGGDGDDKLYAGEEIDLSQAIALGNTQSASEAKGNWLNGANGSDIVLGGGDDDVLYGGDGRDILVGGGGDDHINGDDDYTASKRDWSISALTNPFDWRVYPIHNENTLAGDADVLYGGAGNDQMAGIVGNDILYGESGNDTMAGGDDHDMLFGGDGNDQMTGDGGALAYDEGRGLLVLQGNDYLDGGAGNDWMQGEGGDDQLFGGAGDDQIWGDAIGYLDNSLNGDDYLDGGDGNDQLVGQGGDDRLFGGAGNDRLFGDSVDTPILNQGDDHLSGEDGDDYLEGFAGNDTMLGGRGVDTLLGDDGIDQLSGGEGADTLWGDGDTDLLYGDEGDDYLNGGAGNDTLYGGDGNDQISGGDGNDILYGGAGDDILDGDGGNNILDGGSGNNQLHGGAGNDVFNSHGANDVMDGGAGDDVYYVADAGMAVILDGSGSNVLNIGTGFNAGTVTAALDAEGKQMYVIDAVVENGILVGGTVLADKVQMEHYQFAGNVSLSHAQLLEQSTSSVQIRLNSAGIFNGLGGSDILVGSKDEATGDILSGNAGDDHLFGLDGNDRINGNSGNDLLYGDAGDDTLNGGSGTDLLSGGSGNDTYVFNIGDGRDTLSDIGGDSHIYFGDAIALADLSLIRVGNELMLRYGESDNISIENMLDDDQYMDFNFIDGTTISRLDLLKYFNITKNISIGDAGDNTLTGTNEDNILDGNDGNDVLVGGGGSDVLLGGRGNDIYVFNRGDGADVINEQPGDRNVIQFGSDITLNEMVGQQRIDPDGTTYLILQYGNSGDEIAIRDGFDGAIDSFHFTALGASFSYTELIALLIRTPVMLAGTVGDDVLVGGSGDDVFLNNAGADILKGGKGNDTYILSQGGGSDVVIDMEGENNRILLDAGLTLENIDFVRSGNDLLVQVKVGIDSILLRDYFSCKSIWHVQTSDGALELISDFLPLETNLPAAFALRVKKYQDEFYSAMRTEEGAANADAAQGRFEFSKTVTSGDAEDIYGRANSSLATTTSIGTRVVVTAAYEVLTSIAKNRYISLDEARILYSKAGTAYTADSPQLWNFPAGTQTVVHPGATDALTLDGFLIPDGQKTTSMWIPASSHVEQFVIENTTSAVSAELIVGGDSSNHIHLMVDQFTPNAIGSNAPPYLSIAHKLIDGGGGNDVIGDGVFQQVVDDFNDYGMDFAPGTGWFQSEYGHQAKPGHFLYGNAGDDVLLGGYVADTLIGGAGDDLLNGRYGSDAYLILDGADQGWDTIFDSGVSTKDEGGIAYGGSAYGALVPTDTVVFEAGIKLENLSFSWSESADAGGRMTLNISWRDSAGIRVVLPNDEDVRMQTPDERGLFGEGLGIEQFQFSNGITLNLEQMLALAPTRVIDSAPIAVGQVADQRFEEQVKCTYALPDNLFKDSDPGDILIYSATLLDGQALPAWLLFDSESKAFSGIPAFIDIGKLDIRVIATDRAGKSAGINFSIMIDHVASLHLVGTIGSDSLMGAGGNDILEGKEGKDKLFGLAGADFLDGGAGTDMMSGGIGDDCYVVDAANDFVIENVNEGIDSVLSSVSYVIAANVENLTLTGVAKINGTGNDIDNILIGNLAANSLKGGKGDDIYYVSIGDHVIEKDSAGKDLVVSDVTWTLGANVENLSLSGNAPINANGNALNNMLKGNVNDNVLNGGAGLDCMSGGAGNDIYIVDQFGDSVNESPLEGLDLVKSSISYSLSENIEAVILTGRAAINATGNILDNFLAGNRSNNTLNGEGGNDILIGAAGVDRLVDILGNNVFDGGTGHDMINAGNGNDFIVGGNGNETIVTGDGFDVIAFNRGDGADIILPSTNSDNTLSIGGGISYADLLFKKTDNDLILATGKNERVTMKDWYLSSKNHSIANLQIVIEGSNDYAPFSDNLMSNKKIEQFNFTNLVNKFDQVRSLTPALTSWALSSSLLDFYLAGSDVEAFGGDFAYQYAKNGNIENLSMVPALTLLSSPRFGMENQKLQNLASLIDASPRLM